VARVSSTADLRSIADQLTDLVETSPRSEGRVTAWTYQANMLVEQLRRDYPDVPLPGQVMQYVRDAGARVRNPRERERQDRMMNAIIDELDRGELPGSRGTILGFTPRQLLATGFAATLLIAAIIVRGCVL
jgi:hypothetical protein